MGAQHLKDQPRFSHIPLNMGAATSVRAEVEHSPPPHTPPPLALEWKSIQLIWRRHYSCCLNPIDLLSSQNLISNLLQFVTRCPSPQRRALPYLPESSCASPTSPHRRRVCDFPPVFSPGDAHPTPLFVRRRVRTPSTPVTCNKGRLLRQYPAHCSPGASFN